jgi:hypothetical protein
MIRILLAAAAVTGAAAFDPRPAQAYEAPWCAVVNAGKGSVYWDCQYASLDTCVPHVISGNRGFCNPNPSYNGSETPKKKHAARRRHSEPR